MRAIAARRGVRCAWPGANRRLEAYYERLAGDSRARTLPLRVRLDDVGIPTHLALVRDVRAALVRLPDDETAVTSFHLEWSAAGGPYPRFTGWLFLQCGADDSTSVLEVEGTYIAPFGPMGAAFDAAIGKRIAESTAHALLDDIAAELEAPAAPSAVDPEPAVHPR